MRKRTKLGNRARDGLAGLLLTGMFYAGVQAKETASKPHITTVSPSKYSAPKTGEYLFAGSYKVESGKSGADPLLEELAAQKFTVSAEVAKNPKMKDHWVKRVYVEPDPGVITYLNQHHPDIKPYLVWKDAGEENFSIVDRIKKFLVERSETHATAAPQTRQHYWQMVDTEAKRQGMDIFSFKAYNLAVIDRESSFNPNATGKLYNEKGLSQLRPETGFNLLHTEKEQRHMTASQRAKILAKLGSAHSPLYNPELNIRLLTTLSKQAWYRHHGDVRLMAADHNAGAKNAPGYKSIPRVNTYVANVMTSLSGYMKKGK